MESILPDEIIEIILGYLSAEDLIQMTLVSHHMKWIIENSPELMTKLPVYIKDDDNDLEFCIVVGDNFVENNQKLIEPLMESNKKVRKVIVELKHEKIMKYFGIFKKFGESIRFLIIRNYAFQTLDQLRIILRYLTSLYSLTMINVSILKSENEVLNSIVRMPKLNLTALEIVDISKSDQKIFSLFVNNATVQLREIRLRMDVNDVGNFTFHTDFCDTMSQQRKLLKVTLQGISTDYDDIFQQLKNISNLRYFEIKNCKIHNRESAKNLIEMIKNQKYLQTLKLLNSPLSDSVDTIYTYRNIFHNHIKVAVLDINEHSIINSHSFVNESVRFLTLRSKFAYENLPIFINLIKMFPNVRNLKLVGGSPINEKYLCSIMSHFRYLDELQVPGFTSRTGDSYFSNLNSIDSQLKSLIVDYIDYDVKFFGWKNIMTNLKSIEKFAIKRNYGKVSHEIVDMIIKKLKLRHLELGIGVVSDEILETITQNYNENLKVLKIARCDYEKLSKNSNFDKYIQSNQILFSLCDEAYFTKKSNL